MDEKAGEKNCFHCKHFYITWDEFFPKGCKALGFKSREAPSAVVQRSSGMECQMFEHKKEHGKA
ncbi:MAG TPA: uracil-DNA glycosylase [Deltaproteobacteria bacterium]|nr:MAG: uracil-DNA glycosylase [Deltaproteobacteria bacterium GWA2_55_82]OGQ62785.1 MAG: uracil-DNA glycosylase [Deltaproteobacteria bacterium RIFCSPLOWO2_02_FULL_55_12]OIJ73504.1 MAG: uracil-DNA glycosylase [Deltaproteobacteria bacterium GWC2_55_46]HBG46233.1 uracil-DNA glycosylase [Deltaproteobacteria bacterium]HCY10140.1 uracil-DNA glycosylase [Deltaproteobacteria bacterium]